MTKTEKEWREEFGEPRPCPLCRHRANVIIADEDESCHKIKCRYCGCEFGAPIGRTEDTDYKNIKYMFDSWNKRAEYCQYCGELVGAVEQCPKCGESIVITG